MGLKAPLHIILFLHFILFSHISQSQDTWPKEIPISSGGKVVIYQPQLEGYEGNTLFTRSAVSVRETASSEPVFGAVWADAEMLTDKDTRMATLESIKVKEVRFPNVEDESKIEAFKTLLETEAPKWNYEISIDRIITALEEGGKIQDPNLNTAAPKIIYKNEPSILVLIDGEPQVKKNDDMNMETVVNTPFLIVKNPDDNKFYLFGGDYWYVSSDVTSSWTPAGKLSGTMKDLDQALQEQIRENQEGEMEEVPATPPAIVVSTEPAELIQSDGEPDFQSVEGTSLLYMSNTNNDILMDISSQSYYVLLSGRWYTSSSLQGPWAYKAADDLPADFQKIPPGSDKDAVLANVAGTTQAREATMDAQIPQTAKIDRNSTECDVEYDGRPEFQRIEGTELEVAMNSSTTVLKSGRSYYAVDNGVWFVSQNPDGPWQVSTERPADVDNIPATSTAYNTKYVYIYDVTPNYVYTGYTPGYLGCYVYGPTVVYGTGYYYRPWYRTYYYPRPVTWGFNMHYNPWTGWSMNFGFSAGFFSFSYGSYGRPGGWWGPPMYRPPYRPPYRPYRPGYPNRRPGGYYGNNRINIDNSTNININTGNRTNNLYKRRDDAVTRDRSRVTNRRDNTRNTNSNQRDRQPTTNRPNTRDRNVNTSAPGNRMAEPADRSKNNVYTDRSGNIYRERNNGNWQQRTSSGWDKKSVQPSTRQNLNQQSQMRNRGTTRTNNYQRAATRPATRPAPSRGRRGN